MIRFLLLGVLRDRTRSMFPLVIVGIGVFLTVAASGWIDGIFGDMVDLSARFTTGHVRVITRAYEKNEAQLPNDLALLETDALLRELAREYPDMEWVRRIRFGGLADVADEQGETKRQGPFAGLAIDLLGSGSTEPQRLALSRSLVRGRLPAARGDALLSEEFATQLGVAPGDALTLFSSTMYGSMAFWQCRVAGTVRFGATALDRGGVIVDLADAQDALDMQGAASEVLGYFAGGMYDHARAAQLTAAFNARTDTSDAFAPVMLPLKDQQQLAGLIDYIESLDSILTAIFILIMSVILWNTGLLGGLRRHAEFGVRLALGEDARHLYGSLVLESLLIGVIGSIAGTLVGLACLWYLQEYGLDFSGMMKSTTMMLPTVYRAEITPRSFVIGFIPGVFSMAIGTMLSGIGIFRRSTATLFKELEV